MGNSLRGEAPALGSRRAERGAGGPSAPRAWDHVGLLRLGWRGLWPSGGGRLRAGVLALAGVAVLLAVTAAFRPALAGAPVAGRGDAQWEIPAGAPTFAAIPAQPRLGEAIGPRLARVWGVSLCVIGCLLTLGLYHVALFALRRQVAYFHFALICFLWVGFFVTGDFTQWVAAAFVPMTNPLPLYQVHMSFFLLSRPFGYRFLRALYPGEFPRSYGYVADAMPIVFGPLLLVAPSAYAMWGNPLVHVVTTGLLVYTIWRLAVCARKGKDGAWFLLCGLGVATLPGVYRMLSHDGVIAPLASYRAGVLTMLGVMVYGLSQALALVRQYARAFARVHGLSASLQESNLALRREAEERDRLERQIVNVSEEERRRLSRELHDGLCQNLTAARLRCAILEDVKPGEGGEHLSQLSGLLDASVNEAYGMSRGLWPVECGADAPGLSLEALVRHLAKTSGVKVELVQNLRCPACSNPNAVPVCRIAQEAVVNAIKHARAGRILVNLSCREPGGLRLLVTDDGVGRGGAAASPGGLGMEIMAHRAKMMAATFEIADAPGGGTTVSCVAPCGERPSPAEDTRAAR